MASCLIFRKNYTKSKSGETEQLTDIQWFVDVVASGDGGSGPNCSGTGCSLSGGYGAPGPQCHFELDFTKYSKIVYTGSSSIESKSYNEVTIGSYSQRNISGSYIVTPQDCGGEGIYNFTCYATRNGGAGNAKLSISTIYVTYK